MFSFFNLNLLELPTQDAEVPPGTTLGPRLGPRLAQGCHVPTLRIALGCVAMVDILPCDVGAKTCGKTGRPAVPVLLGSPATTTTEY
jgi:hypothetical protein